MGYKQDNILVDYHGKDIFGAVSMPPHSLLKRGGTVPIEMKTCDRTEALAEDHNRTLWKMFGETFLRETARALAEDPFSRLGFNDWVKRYLGREC
jgi:hypothetical protein